MITISKSLSYLGNCTKGKSIKYNIIKTFRNKLYCILSGDKA